MTSKKKNPVITGPITLRRRHHFSMAAAYLLFLAIVATGNAEKNCTSKIEDCEGSNCTQVVPCENGMCNDEGECVCFPCFSGRTCSQYDDGYPPYFPAYKDLVEVYPDHNGAVYQSKAIDDDLNDMCLEQQWENLPCLCSKVWYNMYWGGAQKDVEDDLFGIEEETGIVYIILGKRLIPGQRYYLTIFASSQGVKDADKMVLYVDVVEAGTPTTFQERSPEKMREKINMVNNLDPAPDNLEEDEDFFLQQYSRSFPESHLQEKNLTWNVREKRDSAGPSDQLDSMLFSLDQLNEISDLTPGDEVQYQLKLVLPTLDTATDLKLEIFVMDPVSAITPFVLCSVSDVSIGAKILNSDGNVISTTDLIDYKTNDLEKTIDKAVLNFGLVTNSDSHVPASQNLDDSTIKLNFRAIFINNPDYKNATAIVTAGAEYATGSHVWISQGTHNINMNAERGTMINSFTGPLEIGYGEAVSCTVDSFLDYAYEEVVLEIFTPLDIQDKFTVERVGVLERGDNFKCTDSPTQLESFPSVSGRGNHMVRATTKFLNGQMNSSTVEERMADEKNKITFGFNIQAMDAKEGEVISVGAGIYITQELVWVSSLNLTVGSPVAPDAGAGLAYEFVKVSESVATGGVASFGIKTTIPAGTKAWVKCSADNSADPKIGGVVYGTVGSNIGYLKDIGKVATTTDDGTLEWDLGYVFNTGKDTVNEEANVFYMEVGVQYSSSISTKSVTCGTTTLEFPILPTHAASGVPSGFLTNLGKSTTWVVGSQAAIQANIHFPPNSLVDESYFEVTGDIGVTNYFPALCRLRLMHVGRGVPSVGFADIINSQVTFAPSRAESTFDDLGLLNLSKIGGVQMQSPDLDQYNVTLQAVFHLPKDQAGFSGGNYQLSAGLKFDDTAVWVGSSTFTTTTTVSYNGGPPRINVIPDSTTIDEGESTRVMVIVKTEPGSIGSYKLTAQSSDPSLALCHIQIQYVGDNYPCVNQEPFRTVPTDTTTTTMEHDPATWNTTATVDFGILQNIGTTEPYTTLIGDSDAILMNVFVFGMAAQSTATLSITFGSLSPVAIPFTISSTAVMSGSLEATLQKQDPQTDPYEEVMHISTLVLTIPKGYNRKVKVKVSTDADQTNMILCLVALAKVGWNVPCTVPVHVEETRNSVGEALQWVELYLGHVCHLETHEAGEQDKLTIYIGTTFTAAGSTEQISVDIYEDDIKMANPPSPLALEKNPNAYVGGNCDPASVMVRAVDNTTTYVTRGSQTMVGFLIDIPVNCTFSINITLVTPSSNGRALATVGGFRWVDGFGKNLGCKAPDCEAYNPLMAQNASGTPFIHETQNDIMVAYLFHISNIGLSYLQGIPTLEQYNQLAFEGMIWTADHPNFETDKNFNVECGVQVDAMIYVISKPLVVSFTGSEEIKILPSLKLVQDQDFFSTNDVVELTYHVQHEANVSMLEANDARIRIFTPPYVKYKEGSNKYSSNLTDSDIIVKDYIDFDIKYLFFTDILEINFTLTINPDDTLPKGLGLTNATTLARVVCKPGNTATAYKYCGSTAYVNYYVDSEDCYDTIDVTNFEPCQFGGSTSIDAFKMPDYVFSTGWWPAVRPNWEHHITIDFLKDIRITRLILDPPADTRPITTVGLQFSRNGFRFSFACKNQIPVEDNVITIPSECRDGIRYVRLLVHGEENREKEPIGLIISKVEGCYTSDEAGTCDTSLETMRTVRTDKAQGWRHIAFDEKKKLFYFCDFVPLRGQMVCYCTPDGSHWTALPSYIGEIIGYSATEEKICAYDTSGRALLCSSDCINWGTIDLATMADVAANAKLKPALVVPGKEDVLVQLEGYTADFNGIRDSGGYKVKWSSCCA